MQYDPDNHVVKLCAEGMKLEGEGKNEGAKQLFLQAWEAATDDLEQSTAAHYVARHQESAADKLKWDEVALSHALKVGNEDIKATYPSLYLNIAKGYEDLHEPDKARMYYKLAYSYAGALPDDGYGRMIRGGISNGLERTKQSE